MTDARHDALHLLLDQASNERDLRATELRRAEDMAQRTRAQGEQLAAYRAEYTQRWSAQFGRGGAIEIVQCYQSFMQRLDEAMVHQQRQVEGAQRHADAARTALVEAERRVAAMRKLIERRHAEAMRVQERRDQRQTDETAAQVVARRAGTRLAVQQ